MELSQELLPGTWLIRLKSFSDSRGSFVKTYARSHVDAAPHLPAFEFKEEFYSVSQKNVLRGMHFQVPPHDHVKLVYCAAGAVLDVLVDLRRGPGYGQVSSVPLQADNPQLLWIPKGIAHGFLSLTDNSLMVYKTSTEHAPQHDAGIRFDSFDFDWGCNRQILSDRDQKHPMLADFQSPF